MTWRPHATSAWLAPFAASQATGPWSVMRDSSPQQSVGSLVFHARSMKSTISQRSSVKRSQLVRVPSMACSTRRSAHLADTPTQQRSVTTRTSTACTARTATTVAAPPRAPQRLPAPRATGARELMNRLALLRSTPAPPAIKSQELQPLLGPRGPLRAQSVTLETIVTVRITTRRPVLRATSAPRAPNLPLSTHALLALVA